MSDPRRIRAIAVTAEDVVAAFEANRRGGTGTVLRVTPPFSGRMRARLHVPAEDGPAAESDPEPVHVRPADLLADPPPYPDPDDTEDELRADPGTAYTPERHHDRHRERIETWRRQVAASVVDAVELDCPGGPHEVEVTVLGEP